MKKPIDKLTIKEIIDLQIKKSEAINFLQDLFNKYPELFDLEYLLNKIDNLDYNKEKENIDNFFLFLLKEINSFSNLQKKQSDEFQKVNNSH